MKVLDPDSARKPKVGAIESEGEGGEPFGAVQGANQPVLDEVLLPRERDLVRVAPVGVDIASRGAARTGYSDRRRSGLSSGQSVGACSKQDD